MKKHVILSLACLLTGLYTFSACNQTATAEKAEEVAPQHAHKDTIEEVVDNLVITSRQFKAAGIELGALQESSLAETIKATGTLDVPPQHYAEVSAYIGGIIKTIHVTEGTFVKKGQTVMTLEHPDFLKLQEEYIGAKNNLTFLEQEYQRKKELIEANATSGKAFQEAESNYNIGKGRLTAISNQLSMLGISTAALNNGNIASTIALRSPISGYVIKLHGSLGSYAEPNKSLFVVVDNSQIQVHLDVYEKDFYNVKTGQKINVFLPNQENVEVEGRIISIGKAMDNTTKSIAIHAEIINKKRLELIPGVFVNALIYVAGHNARAVPAEAIIRTGEKQYVFIVNEELCSKPNVPGKDPHSVKDAYGNTIPLAYKMIEVNTGAEDKGLVEITPLRAILMTDQLVVKGAYYLMSALKSGETVGCCAPAEEEEKKE